MPHQQIQVGGVKQSRLQSQEFAPQQAPITAADVPFSDGDTEVFASRGVSDHFRKAIELPIAGSQIWRVMMGADVGEVFARLRQQFL